MFYLDLFLCELRLCCQAADFCRGGVRKLPVGAAQERIGVHSCAVGGDAAEGDQKLWLSCCWVLLGLKGRKHLEHQTTGRR